MTCSLCPKDSRYGLDIDRTRFPFRNQYAIELCDEHKEQIIKIIDGLITEYYLGVVKK